jgi:hypothetical protein
VESNHNPTELQSNSKCAYVEVDLANLSVNSCRRKKIYHHPNDRKQIAIAYIYIYLKKKIVSYIYIL